MQEQVGFLQKVKTPNLTERQKKNSLRSEELNKNNKNQKNKRCFYKLINLGQNVVVIIVLGSVVQKTKSDRNEAYNK